MYLCLKKQTQEQDTSAAYINLLLKCKQIYEGTAKPTCITYIYEKAEHWAISLCKQLPNPFRCSTSQRGLTKIRTVKNITSVTKESNNNKKQEKEPCDRENSTPILHVTNCKL